ncbi:hypothetical protein [Marispirochaeta aestuarii]|uniref:hypothetical protein n=1 Tax=Marispirochaeta aestuarii TaxID=1963862 RepID=UPI0029C6D764|nr:hypothetical protein [Marispirochaeta aestuarii]
MTHTLHRQGNEESLAKDYTILAMPSSGLNSEGSLPKLQKALEIFMRHDPVNIGDSKGGSRFSLGGDEEVKKILVENELVHAVYRTREQLIDVLVELKKADLGLSVTVGGLMDHVEECCRAAELKPHTIVQSLGIKGKLEKLPNPKVLEIATMCGHHLVSFDLITSLVDRVGKGRMSSEAAGKELAKCCICGVFNPARAAEIIDVMVGKEVESRV